MSKCLGDTPKGLLPSMAMAMQRLHPEDNAGHHRYTSGRRDWSAFHSLQPAPVVEGVSACRDVPLPRRIAERTEAPMLPLNQKSVEIGVALECSVRYTQCGRDLARWQPVLNANSHLLRAMVPSLSPVIDLSELHGT